MPNVGETAGGPAPRWMIGQSKARHKEPSLANEPAICGGQATVGNPNEKQV